MNLNLQKNYQLQIHSGFNIPIDNQELRAGFFKLHRLLYFIRAVCLFTFTCNCRVELGINVAPFMQPLEPGIYNFFI